MLILRSVAFNVLFYLNLILHLIAALPTYALPRQAFNAVARSWGRTSNWLMRAVAGIHVEYRGLEKIPHGGILIASKHQSVWETFTLLTLVDDFAFVLKRELMWIPVFGWYAWKSDQIPVDRGARGPALAKMTVRARQEIARGRQIIIFPEGTRTAPRAKPHYKYGIVHLYSETGTPCLPVALNSGLFWPRRKFLRYPGTIRLEVLDPIAPGLPKAEFATQLTEAIETATNRLMDEGERELEAAGYRRGN